MNEKTAHPDIFLRAMKQLPLIPRKKYRARKVARAIATRRGANHVVLKSRTPILRRHRAVVLRSIRETQDRFGVLLHAFSIMENHIHLVIRASSREQFANALRMLAGTIARRIQKSGRFWLARAWSRVVRRFAGNRNGPAYYWHSSRSRACSSIRW